MKILIIPVLAAATLMLAACSTNGGADTHAATATTGAGGTGAGGATHSGAGAGGTGTGGTTVHD